MQVITVHDKMQDGYSYTLSEPMGEHFDPEFLPQLSPKDMLELGVFGGKYMTDCQNEFPEEWFTNAKLAPLKKNPKLNFFGVNASMPLSDWKIKGRIYPDDPRGRFQRYCRYYMGRRIPDEDRRQIKRRKAIKRHLSALKKGCVYPLDRSCRPRQRQALLHRAYDSRII